MSNVLITGVNGFVGPHLINELIDNNYDLIGIGGRQKDNKNNNKLRHYFEIDLTDAKELKQINFKNIDYVVHLAGLAAVGPSFDDPYKYVSVNMSIEINLFEEAINQKTTPRFLIVSTGALYNSSSTLPLTEASPILPNSPYAVSKIGQEQLAKYYQTRGFECLIARPFNHMGPGQGPGFIVPDLAIQIKAINKGNSKEILVGNLDAKRDYTDVRDIVRAYRLLIEEGKAGETYNICSGVSHNGHDILNGLIKAAVCNPVIKLDPNKLRPSDTPDIFGSYEKLKNDTGWTPEIDINTTLKDVINSMN